MNKIRILIVDNNYRFIRSAINFLSHFENTHPLGGAMSSEIALAMIRTHEPEIILVDQSFVLCPNENFLEKIESISPQSKVIITALDDFTEYKEASLAEGAEAFVSKTEFGTEIMPLIYSLVN